MPDSHALEATWRDLDSLVGPGHMTSTPRVNANKI